MASAAWRSSATGTSDNSTTVTINKPTGTASDDVLFAHIHVWLSAGSIASIDITPPTGWTLCNNTAYTNDLAAGWLFTKRAGGSEPSTYDFVASSTPNGLEGSVSAIQNVDPGQWPTSYSSAQGASSNPDPPAFDNVPVVGNYLVLAFVSDLNATHTPPTNYTERVDAEFISMASRYVTSVTGEDPGTFGTTSAYWVAFTVIFQTRLRFKTLEYWFPTLATAADVTDTNFTQITAYIPEFSGEVVFQSCYLEVQAHDRATTVGNTTRRQLSLSVGGSAYTVVNNTNTLTASGEQLCFSMSADFTALFRSAWTSGTSKTIDARVLFDSSMTTPTGYGNITARLVISFEFDDTVTTHAKTVWIPMNAYVGASPTSKPGSANAGQIPNLTTYCPETSKTFRQITVVVQGNTATVGTTDHSMSIQAGSLGAYTSGNYEAAANTDMFFRLAYQPASFSYSTAYDLFIWGSAARFNHPQVWVVVTYEFDSTGTAQGLVSVWVPLSKELPLLYGVDVDHTNYMYGLTGIPEANPAMVRSAAYLFWQQSAAVSGLNIQGGDDSWVAYTDAAATLGGSNACMFRYDSWSVWTAYESGQSLSLYKTDTADLITGLSGFMLINYTADKPTGGYAVMNHMVMQALALQETTAAAQTRDVTNKPLVAFIANYLFWNTFCLVSRVLKNTTGVFKGYVLYLSEGQTVCEAVFDSDDEVGVYTFIHCMTNRISRYYGHYPPNAIDPQSNTDYYFRLPVNGSTAFFDLESWGSYSQIEYSVSGTLSDYSASESTYVQAYNDDANTDMVHISGGNVDAGASAYTFIHGWPVSDLRILASQTTSGKRGWNNGPLT